MRGDAEEDKVICMAKQQILALFLKSNQSWKTGVIFPTPQEIQKGDPYKDSGRDCVAVSCVAHCCALGWSILFRSAGEFAQMWGI